MVAHAGPLTTAFDDPTAPPNARPRESIEIRTLCVSAGDFGSTSSSATRHESPRSPPVRHGAALQCHHKTSWSRNFLAVASARYAAHLFFQQVFQPSCHWSGMPVTRIIERGVGEFLQRAPLRLQRLRSVLPNRAEFRNISSGRPAQVLACPNKDEAFIYSTTAGRSALVSALN